MQGVSIIIPCYNISKYIEESVKSALDQTFLDIEVVIVDDGSSDDTPKIIKQLAGEDKRIKTISKKNEGLSVARNTGLSAATGEYIVFLDGDDWLMKDAIEVLYHKARKEDLDLLIADTLFYYSDEQSNWVYKRPEHFKNLGIRSGIEYFIELMKNSCYAPMSVNQIYRREYIVKNRLSFFPGLINEDELWTPQVLCIARRVNCIEFPFYYYRQRADSIMNSSVSSKKIRDNLFIGNELIHLSNTYANKELAGWLWVKAFEVYYRAISEYKADKKEIKSVIEIYYSPGRLIKSGIPDQQFDKCLMYIRKSYPNDALVHALLIFRKFRRKVKVFLK